MWILSLFSNATHIYEIILGFLLRNWGRIIRVLGSKLSLGKASTNFIILLSISGDYNYLEIPRQHCGMYIGIISTHHSEQNRTELESSQDQLSRTFWVYWESRRGHHLLPSSPLLRENNKWVTLSNFQIHLSSKGYYGHQNLLQKNKSTSKSLLGWLFGLFPLIQENVRRTK